MIVERVAADLPSRHELQRAAAMLRQRFGAPVWKIDYKFPPVRPA